MSTGPVTPLTPEQTEAVGEHALKENYFVRNLVALDKLVNTLSGGDSNMTISARWALQAEMKPKNELESLQHHIALIGCRVLGMIQENHDAKAVAGDEARDESDLATLQKSGIAPEGDQPQ